MTEEDLKQYTAEMQENGFYKANKFRNNEFLKREGQVYFYLHTCQVLEDMSEGLGMLYWVLNNIQNSAIDDFFNQDVSKMNNKEYNQHQKRKKLFHEMQLFISGAIEKVRDSYQSEIYKYLLCCMSSERRKEFLSKNFSIETFLESIGLPDIIKNEKNFSQNSMKNAMSFLTQMFSGIVGKQIKYDWEKPFLQELVTLVNRYNKKEIEEYQKKSYAKMNLSEQMFLKK